MFDAIDWRRPWLAPLLPLAEPILRAEDWRCALNEAAARTALQNHRGLPLHFVPQADLPSDMAYEAFISATGGVPTRDNLHDFFNAMVWLTFPRIKTQLNALQANAIAKSEAGASRGGLRDAATIFDENAALLVVRVPSLIDDLREHRWHEVFVERRAVFERDCRVWLFGHALMEKLVTPFKAITAHAWPVVVDTGFFEMPSAQQHAWIDAAVATQLEKSLATSDFTPLPVLGVPGWWKCQDEAFYADRAVFRSKRRY